MKKGAIISTVATVAMAAVMCVGLTACGTASAKGMSSEQVTAEQWTKALDFENEIFQNCKIEGTEEMSYNSDGQERKTVQTAEIKVADKKQYAKTEYVQVSFGSTSKSESVTYAEAKSDDLYVTYGKDINGKWTTQESTRLSVDIADVFEDVFGLGSLYESCKYSETDKGYVYEVDRSNDNSTSSSTTDKMKVVLKFKDAKVVGAVYERTVTSKTNYNGEETTSTRVTTRDFVITYGGQSVTLPTVA